MVSGWQNGNSNLIDLSCLRRSDYAGAIMPGRWKVSIMEDFHEIIWFKSILFSSATSKLRTSKPYLSEPFDGVRWPICFWSDMPDRIDYIRYTVSTFLERVRRIRYLKEKLFCEHSEVWLTWNIPNFTHIFRKPFLSFFSESYNRPTPSKRLPESTRWSVWSSIF